MGDEQGKRNGTSHLRLTHDDRRDYIVDCAREVFERQGARKTTMTDIAREAGMTRELLYYYFHNKREVAIAVLDAHVGDYVDSVALWAEGLDDGSCKFEDYVGLFWRALYTEDHQRRAMKRVLAEVGLSSEFEQKVVRSCTDYLRKTNFYKGLQERGISSPDMRIEFVLMGTFCVLAQDPDADQAELARIARQALGLEETETQ